MLARQWGIEIVVIKYGDWTGDTNDGLKQFNWIQLSFQDFWFTINNISDPRVTKETFEWTHTLYNPQLM